MLGVLVEEAVELLDLRQDMAKLIGFEPAHLGDVDDRQPVVGEARDVARAVDDEHRQFWEPHREDGVADGVRRLTLPSFDRVEEHGHR